MYTYSTRRRRWGRAAPCSIFSFLSLLLCFLQMRDCEKLKLSPMRRCFKYIVELRLLRRLATCCVHPRDLQIGMARLTTVSVSALVMIQCSRAFVAPFTPPALPKTGYLLRARRRVCTRRQTRPLHCNSEGGARPAATTATGTQMANARVSSDKPSPLLGRGREVFARDPSCRVIVASHLSISFDTIIVRVVHPNACGADVSL